MQMVMAFATITNQAHRSARARAAMEAAKAVTGVTRAAMEAVKVVTGAAITAAAMEAAITAAVIEAAITGKAADSK